MIKRMKWFLDRMPPSAPMVPLAMLLVSLTCAAQTPAKVGCFDSQNRLISCGARYVGQSGGRVYDCVCNCSGTDQCTVRADGGSGQDAGSAPAPAPDNSAAVDARAKEAQAYEAALDTERQAIFNRSQEELARTLKGADSATAASPGLKGPESATSLGIKSSTSATSVNSITPQVRDELLASAAGAIRARAALPSREGAEILNSLLANKPPRLGQDPLANLVAGDVILIDRIPFAERWKYGWKDTALSQGINFLDRLASSNYTSQASHVALYLGERNGTRWFLNNTGEHGPVIIQESEFLRLYDGRNMNLARLVGKPISQQEGDQIWKAAHAQRETKKYGIWSKDRMVCSESARWALLSTGRDVPENSAGDVKFLGTQSGVNKREVVSFSPADFYASWKYFIIQPLTK